MDYKNLPPEVQRVILGMIGSQQITPEMRAELSAWMSGGGTLSTPALIQGINNIFQSNGLAPVDFTGQATPQGAPPAAPTPGASPIVQGAPNQLAGGGGIAADQDPGIGGGQAAAQQQVVQQARGAAQSVTNGQDPAVLPKTGGGGGAGPSGFDPNSAVGNIPLYGKAQSGDENALAMLMYETLTNLGLDPLAGTEAVQSISQELEPYLRLVMQYSGMGDVAADKGRQYASDFQNMISSPGTFGQIREFGKNVAGDIGGLMADMKDPQREDLINDLIGMTTAGGNRIENTAIQNRRKNDLFKYRYAQAKDPRVDDYAAWLYSDPERAQNPAYKNIAGLLGIGR
jgi:hypothetical protein